MKRLIFALMVVLSSGFSCSAFFYSLNDLERDNIKGNVKAIDVFWVEEPILVDADTIKKYMALNLPVPPERKHYTHVEYNEGGMKVLEDEFFWEWKNVYTYDEKNPRMPVVDDRINFDGTPRRHYTVVLDDEGYPVSGLAVDGDGITVFEETYEKKRDAKTKELTLSINHFNSSGDDTFYNIVYGADGLMKKFNMKDSRAETTFFFNDKEMPDISIRNKYDRIFGTTTTERLEMEYLPAERNTYTVDEKKNRRLLRKERLDENGNEVEIIIFDPEGNVEQSSTIEYIYDARGNWIRQEKFRDGVSSHVEERVITYYE